jgi:hypothetical protein
VEYIKALHVIDPPNGDGNLAKAERFFCQYVPRLSSSGRIETRLTDLISEPVNGTALTFDTALHDPNVQKGEREAADKTKWAWPGQAFLASHFSYMLGDPIIFSAYLINIGALSERSKFGKNGNTVCLHILKTEKIATFLHVSFVHTVKYLKSENLLRKI